MQPTANDQPLRVAIIDDHPISRCAYGALLRSEGVHVVAEYAVDEATTGALRALRADVVIVDVRPGLTAGPDAASRAALSGCLAVLTSSARPSSFGTALDGFPFIAKADICRAALAELITSRSS